MQGITSSPVDSSWNRLILADVLLPDALKAAITHKLSANTATSMFEVNKLSRPGELLPTPLSLSVRDPLIQ